MIKLNYQKGDRVTNKELKATLQSLYDEQGIKEKAKATHITRYYKVKKCKIRIGDKRVDGYEILSVKNQSERSEISQILS